MFYRTWGTRRSIRSEMCRAPCVVASLDAHRTEHLTPPELERVPSPAVNIQSFWDCSPHLGGENACCEVMINFCGGLVRLAGIALALIVAVCIIDPSGLFDAPDSL
jgi:hypothetical protein